MSRKIEIELDDDVLELFEQAKIACKEKFNIDLTLVDCMCNGIGYLHTLSHSPELTGNGIAAIVSKPERQDEQ